MRVSHASDKEKIDQHIKYCFYHFFSMDARWDDSNDAWNFKSFRLTIYESRRTTLILSVPLLNTNLNYFFYCGSRVLYLFVRIYKQHPRPVFGTVKLNHILICQHNMQSELVHTQPLHSTAIASTTDFTFVLVFIDQTSPHMFCIFFGISRHHYPPVTGAIPSFIKFPL